jgi:RHS repeat-associated protein
MVGEKRYEVSNHLGNVLAVISDKTKSVCNNDTVSYFTSEVLYAYDYSPFGAVLPGRQYVADTVCTTVIDYDTTYNDHYTLSFVINTLLAPGQTIRIGTAANSKILATYNPGYVTPFSYIAKILMNINPGGDGIEGYNSGSTVIVHFSADSLGFSCGNVVTAYSGTTALTSVTIDCGIDSIYAVDTFTTCSSSDYRFGFNGMEKDNSIKGNGNSYDFGARIYDSRLGRWLSLDPLFSSFPFESNYTYVANNPIICIDVEGKEKIVVTGGADLHNTNKMNFINASKAQLKEYKKELDKSKSTEKTAWLIFDLDYTEEEKQEFEKWAKENGIEPPVYIKTADEVVSYINSKSVDPHQSPKTRNEDRITDLAIFSHGRPSNIAFGYDNKGISKAFSDPTNFNPEHVEKIYPWAFDFIGGSEIDLWSCNAATPWGWRDKDFSSREELISQCTSTPNLVSLLAKKTGAAVTGFIGQTSYQPCRSIALPRGATTGGNHSPSVNNGEVQSVEVTCTNETCTTE